ncbi:hypothetical protein, partial [Bacillus sp. S10(2024)]
MVLKKASFKLASIFVLSMILLLGLFSPVESYAQTIDNSVALSSEINEGDAALRSDPGENAYYNSLMVKYGVFSHDGVWSWHKGSFGHPIESLAYHYNKHGKSVGATTMTQYINKSIAFKANLKGATTSKVNGAVPNVYR